MYPAVQVYQTVFTSYLGIVPSRVIIVRFSHCAQEIKSLSNGSRWINSNDFVFSINLLIVGNWIKPASLQKSSSSGIDTLSSSLPSFCLIAISQRDVIL
ncbi:MAG: hypothetical protein J6T91_04985 [Alphaproteobacteria bacterium]|nr:hypothetical protein [Alphaproteobacteria bacterium]